MTGEIKRSYAVQGLQQDRWIQLFDSKYLTRDEAIETVEYYREFKQEEPATIFYDKFRVVKNVTYLTEL